MIGIVRSKRFVAVKGERVGGWPVGGNARGRAVALNDPNRTAHPHARGIPQKRRSTITKTSTPPSHGTAVWPIVQQQHISPCGLTRCKQDRAVKRQRKHDSVIKAVASETYDDTKDRNREGKCNEPKKQPSADAFHSRELYRASVDQLQQILNFRDVIRQTSLHRWRHSDCLMQVTEVVMQDE